MLFAGKLANIDGSQTLSVCQQRTCTKPTVPNYTDLAMQRGRPHRDQRHSPRGQHSASAATRVFSLKCFFWSHFRRRERFYVLLGRFQGEEKIALSGDLHLFEVWEHKVTAEYLPNEYWIYWKGRAVGRRIYLNRFHNNVELAGRVFIFLICWVEICRQREGWWTYINNWKKLLKVSRPLLYAYCFRVETSLKIFLAEGGGFGEVSAGRSLSWRALVWTPEGTPITIQNAARSVVQVPRRLKSFVYLA